MIPKEKVYWLFDLLSTTDQSDKSANTNETIKILTLSDLFSRRTRNERTVLQTKMTTGIGNFLYTLRVLRRSIYCWIAL